MLLQAALGELADAVLKSSSGSGNEGKKAVRLTRPATTQAQKQGHELTHPNLICELLEHVKKTNL